MPLSVIREGAEHLPDTLAALVTDELALNDALSALRSYSLLDVQDETLSIHRLVQEVVRDGQSEADQLRWATAAVHLLADAFPFKAADLVQKQSISLGIRLTSSPAGGRGLR